MSRQLGALAVLLAVACQRQGPVPVIAAAPPAAASLPSPATASGRWRIQPLVVTLELGEDQTIAGLDEERVAPLVAARLAEMPQVLAVAATDATYVGPDQVGVQVAIRWQLLDGEGKPRSLAAPPVDGALLLAVAVHAEQAVLRGPGEMAEHLFRATLPLPAERHEPLDAFLVARLADALQPAAAQALGELWVRHLADAAVIALLTAAEDWRKVVGAREVGERKLIAGRETLETLARSSRRNLAIVAIAALARLGDARSVPVLVACLDAAHLDVVDAALLALADMQVPEAHAALVRVAGTAQDAEADTPADAAVRQRARALLAKPPARPSGAVQQ